MKSRILLLIFFVISIQSSLLADRPGNPAKVDKDCKAYVDERIVAVKGVVTDSSADIELLKKEIGEIKNTISRSQSRYGESDAALAPHRYPWEIWLAIAILGFFIWVRTGSKIVTAQASQKQTEVDSNLPKCPRCGQEHDPTDTVCKNPNCKTQF